MKTISRIAHSNDKKNKTRSILIMMSICLTTMLLVIISTVGNGVPETVMLPRIRAISMVLPSISVTTAISRFRPVNSLADRDRKSVV